MTDLEFNRMVACASFRVCSPTHIRAKTAQLKRDHAGVSRRLHAFDDQRLMTPHSGYHWDGSFGRFFEGWYFKVDALRGISDF